MWCCYLLCSLDSNDTYIGASNNPRLRLQEHNNTSKSRKGAKRTRGQSWIPILIISGFQDKRSCLSFEKGWQKVHRRSRLLKQPAILSNIYGIKLCYTKDTRWNRIMDLLFFINNISLIGTKFHLNHLHKFPVFSPDKLIINIFMEEWIADLPWPYFIHHNIF
jgi:predicted GIY-YIG superfamily endonuclease